MIIPVPTIRRSAAPFSGRLVSPPRPAVGFRLRLHSDFARLSTANGREEKQTKILVCLCDYSHFLRLIYTLVSRRAVAPRPTTIRTIRRGESALQRISQIISEITKGLCLHFNLSQGKQARSRASALQHFRLSPARVSATSARRWHCGQV